MKIKYLICLLIMIVGIIVITVSNYKVYNDNYNEKIMLIVNEAIKINPDIEEELINILSSDAVISDEILLKYGYITEDIIIKKNHQSIVNNVLINCGFIFLISLIIYYLHYRDKKKIRREIFQITDYIIQLNNKNYTLDIDSVTEGELSILKNELYKTMVLLKEQASKLNEDKLLMKDNIADISHQLKTPLTSINIMLENILTDKKMNEKVKKDFLLDIKDKVERINFLTQTLLTLSKFDADVVTFQKDNINLKRLVLDSINGLKILIDAKNIEIKYIIPDNIEFVGDYKWQLEAVTNIIKNSVEHSKKGELIELLGSQNNFEIKLLIKDTGKGIKKENIKYIFNRFYKGDNYSDGMGIGLNLAHTIISKDNGFIKVKSEEGKYTMFEIRYRK